MKSAYPKKIVGHIYKSPLSGWYMRCLVAYADGSAMMEYITGEMAGKVNCINAWTVLEYIGTEDMIKPKLVDGVYKNPVSGVYMRCVSANAVGGADMVHMTGAYIGRKDYIPNDIELVFVGTTPYDNRPINKGGNVQKRKYMVANGDELIEFATLGGEPHVDAPEYVSDVDKIQLSISTSEDERNFKFAGYQTIYRLRCDALKGWIKYPIMVNLTMCRGNKDLLRVIDDIVTNRDKLSVSLNGKVTEEEAAEFKKKWEAERNTVTLNPGMMFTPVDDVPEMYKNDPLYIQQYGRGLRIKKKYRINWVWAGIVTWCILSVITAGAFAFNVIMGILK